MLVRGQKETADAISENPEKRTDYPGNPCTGFLLQCMSLHLAHGCPRWRAPIAVQQLLQTSVRYLLVSSGRCWWEKTREAAGVHGAG
jgi:hypothetical protein